LAKAPRMTERESEAGDHRRGAADPGLANPFKVRGFQSETRWGLDDRGEIAALYRVMSFRLGREVSSGAPIARDCIMPYRVAFELRDGPQVNPVRVGAFRTKTNMLHELGARWDFSGGADGRSPEPNFRMESRRSHF
jgi:hypothetical protein